ncbi:MAG: molybdopterin-dependent oxidoreductase [Myxococcota bacterium]|nr:molybdopterin-dependent oxidoreductase [Myxococcota bacterium]
MAKPFTQMIVRPIDRRTLVAGGVLAVVEASIVGCRKPSSKAREDSGDIQVLGPEELDPISSNDDFYTVLYWGTPEIDLETWEIAVRGLDGSLSTLDYLLLESLEAREKEHTLQCIESRPSAPRMSNAMWSGLPLLEVLEAAGIEIDSGCTHLKFTGADGYTMGLPVTDLNKPVWLVWGMNGEVLPSIHGFPARLLTPGQFGWLNPKFVVGIEFLDQPYELPWLQMMEAYMEDMGLHPESDGDAIHLGVQSLVVFPSDLQFVANGSKVRVLGKAYGGSDPVTWVQVSTDGGASFQDAELTYAPGADRWTLWRFVWEPSEPGVYTLMTRCGTAGGQETVEDFPENRIPWVGGMGLSVEVIG